MNALRETPLEQVAAPRILFVDDDRELREVTAGVLLNFGYSVDTAKNGADGWQALNDHQYDLLITDNRMPKVTGMELIQKVRTASMELPVIMASGTMPTDEFDRQTWLRPDAVLHKPFSNDELLNAVKRVLVKTKSIANSAQLFRVCATMDDTIAQDEAVSKASIRNQRNPAQLILVVDDDKDVRQLSMDILAISGYAVEGVGDGAAGWAALQAKNYDLIITDNHMPNMTGLEMIAKLRSARMRVPIIMATGVLPMQEFERNPRLRPEATLQRPFSIDDLRETVKQVLRTNGGDKAATILMEF